MAADQSVFLESRTAFVLKALARLEPGSRRLLDVGFIGDGEAASLHYSIRNALRSGDALTGIDTNHDGMERFLAHPRTKDVPPGVTTAYRTMSLFDCDFSDGSFDAIFLCEVLEHLEDPFGALRALTRVLRPGGLLVLTYPNPLSLPLFVRYLLQRDIFSGPFLDRFRGASDHLSFPHPASVAVVLRSMGYADGSVAFMKIRGGAIMTFAATVLPPLRKFSSYVGICAIKV